MTTKSNKAVLNESDMEKVVENTAQMLQKQKKVKVKIYLNPDQKKDLDAKVQAKKNVKWPSETVQINGHTYQIQLGKEVEVPEEVAEVLRRADLI